MKLGGNPFIGRGGGGGGSMIEINIPIIPLIKCYMPPIND
jgi:hypothetical protein